MRAEGDSDAGMAPMRDPTLVPVDGRERDGASGGPRGVADHRALFETMPQGVVYQDDAGRIVSANPAAERILGLSLDQMRGRTTVDPRWKATREDGTDILGEEHPAMLALRDGHPVRGAVMGIYRPDEAAYRWIAADATPLVAPGADRPHGVVTVLDDITARKGAEEALRAAARAATERASELEATLGAMADGVIVYDAEGRKIGDNRALRALLGLDARPDYDRLTLAGRAELLDIRDEAGDLVAARDLPPARALGGEDITGPRAVDLSIRTLDGRRVQTNVSAAAARDGDGRIVGAVAVYRDVTERRRLERRTAEVLDALLAMARTLVGDDEGDGSAATIPDGERGARRGRAPGGADARCPGVQARGHHRARRDDRRGAPARGGRHDAGRGGGVARGTAGGHAARATRRRAPRSPR